MLYPLSYGGALHCESSILPDAAAAAGLRRAAVTKAAWIPVILGDQRATYCNFLQIDSEIELKFIVPPASRKAMMAELARASSSLERRTLAAMYLDTPDRRLADEGMAWRLRREGRRWVQTLKAAGVNALERFEHEVLRPDDTPDPALHAGTPVGDRLLKLLRKAASDGQHVGVRYRTQVRRTLRRVRTRGAVVEVAFDEGRLLAGDPTVSATSARICEIEFELVSGSPQALLALAERWRKRFGLVFDPRSKAERGDALASGDPYPPVRKARRPDYPRDAEVLVAFGAVLDECLAQVSRNAIGLIAGDERRRVDHVHQLRVGIRRLRSALRSFRGWVPEPPVERVSGLRELFAALGQARDADVLDSGVALSLAAAGAPPLAAHVAGKAPDPVALVQSPDVQRLLLAWIDWRFTIFGESVASIVQEDPDGEAAGLPDAEAGEERKAIDPRRRLGDPRLAVRRLRRWHEAIAVAGRSFETLDDEAIHALRKRIKRQRYAAEFFSPVLRGGELSRYLKRLASAQDRMGELNDLFVARERYQALVAEDPAAWFAIGWLAARIEVVKQAASRALVRLAQADSPGR